MDELLRVAVDSFIKAYAKDAKDLFEDLFDAGRQFLEKGLKKYLHKCESRYSKVKTLLHGTTPVPLYSIYYHLNVYVEKKQFYSTKHIATLFNSRKNCITIIGEAGSGKSTLIKHLFLDCICTKFGIPILLELRHLSESSGNIEDALYKILLKEDIVVSESVIETLLNKGKFVFFLDGFDEIPSRIKEESIKSLIDFINKYDANKFLLTTRPHADAEYLPRFYNHRIGKLNAINDMFDFIRKQLSFDEDEREIASKIIESIRNNDQKYIYSFLTNPLLLSIYILTFQTNALIPAKKHIFYERVIVALFSEHDSRSKMALSRERLSTLSQEQIEDLLGLFCMYSFFANKYDWNRAYVRDQFRAIKPMSSARDIIFEVDKLVKDLTTGLSLWTEDSGVLSFAHRTLQEYYTARLVTNLKSDQKYNFYSLLISKYVKSTEHPYLLSLLSFLEEMDPFSYKKHFMLPILREIKSDFDSYNNNSLGIRCLAYFGYDLNQNALVAYQPRIFSIGKYVPLVKKLNQDLQKTMRQLSAKKSLNFSYDGLANDAIINSFGSKDIIDKNNDGTINRLAEGDWEIFEILSEFDDDDINEKVESSKEKSITQIKQIEKLMVKRNEILNNSLKDIVLSFKADLNQGINDIETYISKTEHDENKIISFLSRLSTPNSGI